MLKWRYKLLVGVDARKWNTLYLTERVSQNVTWIIDQDNLFRQGKLQPLYSSSSLSG